MFRNRKLVHVSLLCILGWLASGCNEDINNSDTPSDGGGSGGGVMSVAMALEQVDQEIGELDHSTSVAGTDTNGDNVRDDIERYIAALPDSEEQKNSLRQLSQAIAAATVVGASGNTNNTSLRNVARDIDRAVECIFERYENISDASDQVDLIQKITANTPERYRGYMQFNSSVSGFVIGSGAGDYCND